MSDIFALDTNGSRALDEEARANPLRLEDLPTPAWKGAGSAFKGLLRPGADAGRALMIAGAVVPIFDDWLTGAITGKPTDSSKDWYFRNVVDDTANSAIDYWTPGPGEMGSASKALNVGATVLGTLPQIFGTPELFLGQSALSPATEVVRQGGDVDTAAIVGGVNLAANAIGMKLPAAWGTSLQARLATGAGSNLGLGVIADAVSATALRADDMGDMAAGYDWSDPTARGLDLLMGLAFGYKAHVDAPKAMTGGQRDAVLTARNSDHLHRQTMPGDPVTPRAQTMHANTLSSAIEQVLRGEQVNVADAINPADFVLRPELRPDPAITSGFPSGSEVAYDRFLVALESGGKADAKAPTSSATGLHQFTDGTWLRTVQQAAPEWAQGLDRAQLLAARTDPVKSAQMERALRAQNASALQQAGLPADTFNLYAAHHFGEAGGIRFGKAAGDTPMEKILSKAQIDANPYLRGKTKDQAVANWTRRAQRAGVNVDGSLVDIDPAGQALRKRLVEDPEKLAREYAALEDSKGGTVLNTDIARELSPEYLANRTRSADVHEAASDTIKTLYETKLANPTPEGFERTVLFTAGGTGAGKTTAVAAAGDVFGRPEIIYDTNMNSLASSLEKVEQALAAGRDVVIAYVYRDPVEALTGGAIPRAQRQAQKFGSGRTVPLEEHARTHAGVRSVMDAIAERYAGDDRVTIRAIDNSRGQGRSQVVDLAALPKVEENTLRERLQAALEEARTAGLDEATYQGFRAGARDPGPARDPLGAGARGRPEPGDRGQVSAAEPDALLAMDEAASAEPARTAHPADFEAEARTRTADLFNRLDAADRSAARTSAFGIQIDRKADGSYHLTDTRDHGKLSDDAQFIGRDGETMDRKQAVAFMENVTQEANRQRTQAPHQPETHFDAALRLSTDAPDTPVFVGMDIDGNATYRTAAEEMADIRAEQQRAETEANAFTAAANCAIRNGIV